MLFRSLRSVAHEFDQIHVQLSEATDSIRTEQNNRLRTDKEEVCQTRIFEMNAVRDLLRRSGLASEQIGELILGQVLTAGSGQNPARQSVIKAGYPQSVPAITFSLPTSLAYRSMRCATSSGCSTISLA